jgi:phosphatidylethanolamine/phosphatidyl-N-methylethanolamine N-methyltransferase
MSRLLAAHLQRRRFSMYAPIYDMLVKLRAPRRRSIDALELRDGETVLLVGAGTGADLPLLPPGVRAVATDVTPAMLERAKRKARPGDRLLVMDAHHLEFSDQTFDAVILHLILALVEDPVCCLREASRVLRPGGRMAVFDKLLPEDARVGALRRTVNGLAMVVATDINRRFSDLLRRAAVPLTLERDVPVAFWGLFRAILLRKQGDCGGAR